jgi:hypothetical protein
MVGTLNPYADLTPAKPAAVAGLERGTSFSTYRSLRTDYKAEPAPVLDKVNPVIDSDGSIAGFKVKTASGDYMIGPDGKVISSKGGSAGSGDGAAEAVRAVFTAVSDGDFVKQSMQNAERIAVANGLPFDQKAFKQGIAQIQERLGATDEADKVKTKTAEVSAAPAVNPETAPTTVAAADTRKRTPYRSLTLGA